MSNNRRLPCLNLLLFPALLSGLSSISVTQFALAASQTNDTQIFDMSLEELLEIKVVSVTRREESILHSPSAIQVITGEQIRMAGVNSIPEALRLASNLQIAQQNTNEWIITARGFSTDVGNKLLVLIDGRTVYTPLFSGVFWNRQDYVLEDIERIEVISGPGGTMWGANAVNGVINIITKRADATRGLYAEASAGTQLEHQFGVRYGTQLNENTALRVYGKFREFDTNYLSDGSRGGDAWHMAQTGFRMDAQPSAENSFTLQGDYYTSEINAGPEAEVDTSGGNILGRWTRKLHANSEFQLQIYYDHTSFYLPTFPLIINDILLAPAGALKDELDTFDLDFQYQVTFGDTHQLMWGAAWRYSDDETSNSPAIGFFPEHLEQNIYSAFIQDEISLIPNELSFTIGTKVEKNDYTGTEWQPGVRLQWSYSRNAMLWSAVSRAVRMPSRLDREITQATPPNFVILAGGPDFKSENVTAWEVGWRTKISEQLTGSIATYYNEYTDLRSTSLSPDTIFPLFFENNLEGETWGLELTTSYQPTDWWRLHLGYNFMEQDLRVKEGAFDFNNALNETADPQHQVSLRSTVKYEDFELSVQFRWVDELPTNNSGNLVVVDSYSELDMKLGWLPGENIELALGGQNLLHEHHQEFGIPGPQQQEVGRNVYLKVQLRY